MMRSHNNYRATYFRHEIVSRHYLKRSTPILEKQLLTVESSGLSVVGPVRKENQDAILLPNGQDSSSAGLYAVADGMGGYAQGSLASKVALETFSRKFFEKINPDPQTLHRGIESANIEVYLAAQRLGVGRMGTTLTAAYILDSTVYLVHVGDSRAYLIHNGRALCLTADHTNVGSMVRAKLISPDKVRTHALRSILTKTIGLGLFVQGDISQHKLHAGDHLILCTDGIWSVIQDDEFAKLVKDNLTPAEISQKLVDLALQRETDDNASVIVLYMRR